MSVAKDIMIKNVIVINEDSPILELSKVLVKNKMSGLPVVNSNNKLVGFVSQQDIIASLTKPNILKKKTKDIMVKNVISVHKDTSVEEISKIFSEQPMRCLPVIESEKVVGAVLRKAVINRLLGYYY